MKPHTTVLLAALLFAQAAQCIPTRQFDQFFPGWNSLIQKLLREKCSEQLKTYKSEIMPVGPDVGLSSLVTPVIDCLLTEFPEFRKTELAASAVILGAMPTILQTIGSLTVEMALLSLRRPFLSFLLAAGSPAVQTMKSGQFSETLAAFVEKGESTRLPGFRWTAIPRPLRPLVSVVEYILVGGAVANVVMLAYQLGVHAIVVFAPETIFMLPLWTFLAVIIHVGGVIALHFRVKIVSASPTLSRRRDSGFAAWVPNEVIPSGLQPTRHLQWREENIGFLAMSWLLGIGTLAHVVFGTLIFSSLLFFSVIDAVTIVGRYAASALICRAIVRVELSGMGQINMDGGTDEIYVQANSKDRNDDGRVDIPLA